MNAAVRSFSETQRVSADGCLHMSFFGIISRKFCGHQIFRIFLCQTIVLESSQSILSYSSPFVPIRTITKIKNTWSHHAVLPFLSPLVFHSN